LHVEKLSRFLYTQTVSCGNNIVYNGFAGKIWKIYMYFQKKNVENEQQKRTDARL